VETLEAADGSGADPRLRARLRGRSHEVGEVIRTVDRLVAGHGGALVLRGDPGIGKSALLDVAVEQARQRSVRVLAATGVQAETRLPFAGLHQLLEPVLDLADLLPQQQRNSLLGAFGIVRNGATDPFLTALATLELIVEVAAGCPVLLVAEDAQWLDQPSCAALSFVARRLDTEAVLVLIAMRAGHATAFDGVGLAELHLGPLDDAAAAAVLDDRSPELDARLRRRVLAEAAGNPLALIELPISLATEHLHGEPSITEPVPLTSRLERAFAARAAELGSEARALLLVAAADDRGLVAEIMGATAYMLDAEPPADALDTTVDAGLIYVEGAAMRFRHPLIRSAIYQAASVSQRHAAHAALAAALANQPHRRAWHRAAATFGPDELAAAELDDVAQEARQRGALAVTVTASERAADLSADPGRRGARALAAAEAAFDLGRSDIGLRLLSAAADGDLLAPADRNRLRWLAELHDAGRHPGMPASAIAEVAAEMHRDGHGDLAWQLLLRIATSCWWDPSDPEVATAVCAAAEQIAGPEDEPALLTILAHARPVEQGAHVLARLATQGTHDADAQGLHHLGSAASAVWAHDLALPFLAAAVDGLRDQGRLGLLAQALTTQAWAAVHAAKEPMAIATADEGARLAVETGQPEWAASAHLARAAIAAERGDSAATEELIGRAEGLLVPVGAIKLLSLAEFVRGRGAVAHQRYEEGIDYLRRVLDPSEPVYQPHVGAWGLSDLVEACTRTGRRAEASGYLAALEALAETTSGSLLRAAAGYARPLLAADEDAEALYVNAVEHHLAAWPCYRGRMFLWYGRWLRRQRRIAESRTPLRAARQIFDALAFPALADTARQELRASGETSGRRVDQPWDRLTPQELAIARLAAQGLTNRQIGEKLYLSHRTVGFHLHRIYPKLGITSRTQLEARAVIEYAESIA
jgi:DNA-binding CsgD family transcriptional regulator